MKITFSLFLILVFTSAAISQQIGINKDIPEHTLDVRVPSINAAAGLNISNQDKSRYLRLSSGSNVSPDPTFSWAPGRSLLLATYNDNTQTFTEYLRISSVGDVGIGINNPQAKLDVLGGDWNLDAGNPGDFRIGNETYNVRIGIALAGSGAGITRMYAKGNSLMLGTNNRPSLTIGKNENVGLGTTEPKGRLEIYSSGLSDTLILLKNAVTNGATDYGLYFNDENPKSTIGAYFVVDSSAIISSSDCIGCNIISASSISSVGSYRAVFGSVNSNNAIGVEGRNSNANGTGIKGYVSTGTGDGTGVLGESLTSMGSGMVAKGFIGLRAESNAAGSSGIVAYNFSTIGETRGITSRVYSQSGIGIYSEGPKTGILGVATSTGVGVKGNGGERGVEGISLGFVGRGVYGNGVVGVEGISNVNGGRGISGEATGTTGIGVYGTGQIGLYALATTNTGQGGIGRAEGANGQGIRGEAIGITGQGVRGQATGESGKAIYGEATGQFGKGVHAKITSTHSSANAILAESGGGSSYAGYFIGNVHVAGVLSKSSGTFKIDHPLDPENKYLSHSFVESPDMMNIYNGIVTTDSGGNAMVELPDYFEALNMDFRYQLTVIGEFAQAIIGEKIKGNSFKIRTDKPEIEVSWQVTGVRNDEFAKKNRVTVEEEKEPENQGKYLNAAAFDQPTTKQIGIANSGNEN